LPNKLTLAAFAASLFPGTALATQGFTCRSLDGDASISMSLGSAGGLGFAGAQMSHGESRWVTDPAFGDGTIFTFGQGFADADGMRIDFFDEIVNEPVAQLRVVRAEEDEAVVHAGTLRIIGHGVWAVACGEEYKGCALRPF
jgi:hypothetical protein